MALSVDDYALYEQSFREWIAAEKANPGTFPVNLNEVWKWVGYARKDVAVHRATKDLKENEHFHKSLEKSTGGRPTQTISLNCRAFKEFCMLARTERGSAVRKYFIDVEEKYQAVIANIESGRIEVTDTNTGEVYDPHKKRKEDIHKELSLCVDRLDAVEANKSAASALLLLPDTTAETFIRKNVMIAQAVAHATPSEIRSKLNLKKGESARNGFGPAMLRGSAFMESLLETHARTCPTAKDAMAAFTNDTRTMQTLTEPIKNDFAGKATTPAVARKRKRELQGELATIDNPECIQPPQIAAAPTSPPRQQSDEPKTKVLVVPQTHTNTITQYFKRTTSVTTEEII